MQTSPACPDILIQSGLHPTIDPANIPVRSPAGVWPQNYTDTDGSGNASAGPSLSLQTFTKPALDHLKLTISQLRKLAGSRSVTPLEEATQQQSSPSLAWHPQQPILATVDTQVDSSLQIFDFTDKIPYLGQQTQSSVPPLSPSTTLKHELQEGACSGAVAWRPTSSTTVAVGCSRGVCLWHNIKDTSNTSLIWLQSPGEVAVHALYWHPRGHLLAGASRHRPGLFIWDVATGSVTSIRAGLEHVTMLRWSPCGCYLFAGGKTGSFRIWETVYWKSAKWALGGGTGSTVGSTARGSGELVGAEWSPDGRTLLLAHSHQIAALHFTADVPALTAQVLPVSLAELTSGGSGTSSSGSRPTVQSVAWDPRGQRLAIALETSISPSSGPVSSIVAMYDARCDPILTARFIGYARVVPFGEHGSDSDWEIVEPEEGQEGAGAMVESSGEKAAMAFMPSFAQGAVLSVRKGGFIGTLPMYFSM
jgi:WD40 repeat protein